MGSKDLVPPSSDDPTAGGVNGTQGPLIVREGETTQVGGGLSVGILGRLWLNLWFLSLLLRPPEPTA